MDLDEEGEAMRNARTTLRRWRLAAGAGCLWLTAALLVGCGDTGQQAARAASGGGGQMETSIGPLGESGVQGTVRFTPGADSLTVKLELLGLSEGKSYPVALLEGGCDQPGEKVADLDTPHVGTVGVGSSLTRLAPGVLSEGRTYALRVLSPEGDPVACGEITPGGA